MLLNWDLAGAEWVIVAYLCVDPNMLRIVENKLDAHAETGQLITGAPIELIQRERKLLGEMTDANRIEELRRQHIPELFDVRFLPRTMSIRQAGKKANHGLNYGEEYRTFALMNEIEEKEAKSIIHAYRYIAYPGIVEWYQEIKDDLRAGGRVLYDLLDSKCFFMGNWNEDLYRQAYAFKPQGTVGRITCRALSLAMDDDEPYMQLLELLAQVHDSVKGSYPLEWLNMARAVLRMKQHMSVPLKAKGREFVLGVDFKCGLNGADMVEVRMGDDADALAGLLEQAYSKLTIRKVAV
jgi:DNA polymerase I-like protein with 3'-5' exonuclease and polymerase domains